MDYEAKNAFNEYNKQIFMGCTSLEESWFIKGFMYAMDPDRPKFPNDHLIPIKMHGCGDCTFYACENGCTCG